MISNLIKEVEGVFGLSSPVRRKKRTIKTVRTRSYSAPARRTATKRKAKRTTARRRY